MVKQFNSNSQSGSQGGYNREGGRPSYQKPQGGQSGQGGQDFRKPFPNRRGPPMRGGRKATVQPYIHKGVFLTQGDNDAILTKSLVPGEAVYGEKRISIEEGTQKVEYRVWNPYRSKIGAYITAGVDLLGFGPGSKVLYLGAASGTTCSHVADVIGEHGVLYGVEFSARCGRDLISMAKKRTNVVPIIEDARKPWNYRFIVEMVDFVFADVAQPDQARIIALNCKHFLKNGGMFMIAIKASCIDSTKAPKVVFQAEVEKLKQEGLTPKKFITLDPYQKDHAMIVGYFRPAN